MPMRTLEEDVAREDSTFINNSIELPSSSSSVEEEEMGMEINDNFEKWMKQLGNSNKSSNNNWGADNNVITQAFKFVKLDSHLGFLVSQASLYFLTKVFAGGFSLALC